MDTGYFTSWPPRPDPPPRSTTLPPTTPAPPPPEPSLPSHPDVAPIPIVTAATPDHPLSYASSSSSYPGSSYSPSSAHPSSVGSDIVFQPLPPPVRSTAPLAPIQEQAVHPAAIPHAGDHPSFPPEPPSSSISTPAPLPVSEDAPQSVSFAPDPPRPVLPSPALPPLTITTNASDLALRNAVSGGLMSSPTAMPPATYISKMFNSAPSAAPSLYSPLHVHNNSNISTGHHAPHRRSSMKRSSISSASERSGHIPSKGISALSSMIAAENAHNTAIIAAATAAGGHKSKRPDIRPYHYSFGNMGMIYPPPRSMSFTGPSAAGRSFNISTGRTAISAGSDGVARNGGESHYDQQQQQSPQEQDPPGLRKSLSMGKTGKRGFATRLRKLRKRRGSGSHGATSGESDAEGLPPFGKGYTQKSPSFKKPLRTGQVDPSLPPPPPMRVNSGPSKDTSTVSPTYAIPYGFGNMGVAPLSIVTKPVAPKNTSAPPSSNGGMALPPSLMMSSDQKETSSATRFKQMIKRNVGLSSTGHSPTAATAMLSPGSHLGSPTPSLKTSASWNGSNDFLPLDDQSFSSRSGRVPRQPGTGRKARLARKLIPGYGPPSDDGGDNESTAGSPLTMREHHHRHHLFLPHLHAHPHKTRDHGASDQSGSEIGGQLPRPPVATLSSPLRESGEREYLAPGISKALKKARQANQETNVLVAEVRPLPRKFVEAYAALQGPPKKKATVTGPTCTRQSAANPVPSQPQQRGGMSVNAVASLGPGANISILPIMTAPMLRTQRIVTVANTASGTVSARSTPPPLPPRNIDPIGTKSFLFKSYQHSKFRGHYIFRVLGDKVQYCKLPAGLEQACCQYFREADVTYRSIESKSKEWREQKRAALEKREREFRQAQASKLWISPLKIPSRPRLARKPQSDPQQQQQQTQTGPGEENGVVDVRGSGLQSKSPDVMSNEDKITAANTLINASADEATLSSQEDEPNDPSLSLRGYGYERSNSDPTGVLSDELRRDLEASTGVFSSALSDHGEDEDPALAFEQSLKEPRLSFSSLTSKIADESVLVLLQQEEERWEHFKEQQQLEQIQRGYDHAYWLEIEQGNCRAAKEAYYGLELYLHELLRIAQVEYETFDLLTEVSIRNENKDSTLLTVINGDRTNVVSLESPSLRQKYEFLNWVAICLMDHGECPESDLIQSVCVKKQRTRLDGHPNLEADTLNYGRYMRASKEEFRSRRDREGKTKFLLEAPIMDKRMDDSILEISTIRLTLMEVEIRSKREQVAATMKGIEDALGQLDNLDENAKRLLLSMQRSIEGQEVQTALRPAPTTGFTLAETVQYKLKDVNDRIIVCTRIMGAARLNLNRLKYEMELEQRSMRLFRQYKIAICIMSILLLGLGYYLYHQRVEQRLQEKLNYLQQQHQIRQQRFHHFLGTTDPRDGRKEGTSPKSPLQVILLGGPDAADLPPPETTSPFFDHPVQNPFDFLNKFHAGDDSEKDKKHPQRKMKKAKNTWLFFSLKEPVELDMTEWDKLELCPSQENKD